MFGIAFDARQLPEWFLGHLESQCMEGRSIMGILAITANLHLLKRGSALLDILRGLL